MSLCKYKNIFGKPKEGVHSYRIFNIAIVDVLATIFVAYIIKLLFPNYNYYLILFTLFLLGIFLHHIFCVKTTIDKLIFNN